MAGKIRVGLLFGGRSGEHRVSLVSAASVMAAIDRTKYEVVPIGITPQGEWVIGKEPQAFLAEGVVRKLAGERAETDTGGTRDPSPLPSPLSPSSPPSLFQAGERLDVVFPVLHGPFGEDGTVQGLLELADVPYVGAGVLASAVGMDKAIMKALFRERNFPVLPALTITRRLWEAKPDEVRAMVEQHLTYPLFVKPANLGSSVGISKVRQASELAAAIDTAALYDRKILIEQGIACREIECAVLGNDYPQASVVGEIIPHREFYDYEAKYTPGEADLLIPAPLSDALTEQVRTLAVAAFQAIDCAGMARVDFFLEKETERLYLNEINTIPGFTSLSMYARLWEASGLPYPLLIDRLIELALERYQDKKRSQSWIEHL
ncbi:MAG: D-alanine--D-alanine ligase [Nitrospinota bacterium]|nr:MAG: D-alanine--D-alanine ligase [Nitrospinota bacterium]